MPGGNGLMAWERSMMPPGRIAPDIMARAVAHEDAVARTQVAFEISPFQRKSLRSCGLVRLISRSNWINLRLVEPLVRPWEMIPGYSLIKPT